MASRGQSKYLRRYVSSDDSNDGSADGEAEATTFTLEAYLRLRVETGRFQLVAKTMFLHWVRSTRS